MINSSVYFRPKRSPILQAAAVLDLAIPVVCPEAGERRSTGCPPDLAPSQEGTRWLCIPGAVAMFFPGLALATVSRLSFYTGLSSLSVGVWSAILSSVFLLTFLLYCGI